MMQVNSTCIIFLFGVNCLVRFFGRKKNRFEMRRYLERTVFLLLFSGYLWTGLTLFAQQAKTSPAHGSELSPEKAVASAEQGHCRENIPALKSAMAAQVPAV